LVKKWSKSVKKLKKVTKTVKKSGIRTPLKSEKVSKLEKKSAKKVKTRPLKVSRIYVFLKLAFWTSFSDRLNWHFGPLFLTLFDPDFDPPEKVKK